VPQAVVEEARRGVAQAQGHEAVGRFLYLLLRGDGRLRALQDKLAEEPRFLSDLAADLFPNREDADERLINLVNLAVRARPGAFACLNTAAHEGAEDNPARLFLTRREECPHCHSQVFELATCPRCGAAYVVGRLTYGPNGDRQSLLSDTERGRGRGQMYLRHLTGPFDDLRGKRAYFLLAEQTAGLDEDEAVATGEDLDAIAEDECEPYTLCLGCGAIVPGNNASTECGCDASVPRLTLRYVDLQDKPELRRCVSCGSRSNTGIVYRFLTGQDAPVSVLATALYQNLPASGLPGQGRKLLAFSDSRQDAAFFAPYLERTYQQLLRRRLILKTLLDDPTGREGRLRLQDLVGRLQRQAEEAGLFAQRQSYDERQRLMATWLMQELIAWDHRISLEGLGLLRFRLVRPDRWRPPQPLLEPPWNLTPDEAWQLLELLLDTLRHQGAVTFPDNVDPRDEAFAPRNRELFMRESQADSKNGQGVEWHLASPDRFQLGVARSSAQREPAPGWRGSSHQSPLLGSGPTERSRR